MVNVANHVKNLELDLNHKFSFNIRTIEKYSKNQ